MNDKIPGSCWDNPIFYRNYRIYLNDYSSYSGPGAHRVAYAFTHEDYDGAEDANDNRFGYAATVDACKDEIDIIEDDD